MTNVMHSVEEATPEKLTAILRREGVLQHGTVRDVQVGTNPAFNSRVWHLALTYDKADTPTPARLLLKCNLQETWATRGGQLEVALYHMARDLPRHPDVLVRSFDEAYDPTTADSHLLLLDVSATHELALSRDLQLTPGKNVPSDETLKAVVTTLARLHAFWWQHPQLGGKVIEVGSWCSTEEALRHEVQRREQAFNRLLSEEGDALDSRLVRLYESIFPRLLEIWTTHLLPRAQSKSQLTLTHGDAYFANFLVPKAGVRAPTYLIDWQSYEANLGASDLATMTATFWTREQRIEGDRELKALHLYHDVLCVSGVTGYAWEDLLRDYRLALLYWMLVPLQDRLDGSERSYWLTKMACLAHAFEEWQGNALLYS